MIIKSPFKDCYDFIPQSLGFIPDPKFTYNRSKVSSVYESQTDARKIPFQDKYIQVLDIPQDVCKSKIYALDEFNYNQYPIKVLVVCDLIVPVAYDSTEGKYTIMHVNHPRYIHETESARSFYYFSNKYNFDKLLPYIDSTVSESLSRHIKSPVYLINSYSIYRTAKTVKKFLLIEDNIPNLTEYKINKVYDLNALYQDIDYYVSNFLYPSPDLEPPLTISNTERIIAAGFNTTTSFRNC